MFKINQVVFDTENKEFVKITNLRPALKADEFGEQGEMIPFEGVALRITQINKKTKNLLFVSPIEKLRLINFVKQRILGVVLMIL